MKPIKKLPITKSLPKKGIRVSKVHPKEKPVKQKMYEMLLRYGTAENRSELIQRLSFKARNFTHAMKEAVILKDLIARSGNYNRLFLIAVAEQNALKEYAKMPSAVSYLGAHKQPEFVKQALLDSKKKKSGKVKTKPTVIDNIPPPTFNIRGRKK